MYGHQPGGPAAAPRPLSCLARPEVTADIFLSFIPACAVPVHTWEASDLFHGVEGAIAQLSRGATDAREFRQETQVQIWGQGTWK